MPFIPSLDFPTWTSSSKPNRWSDFIELRCLFGSDHFIANDDILNLYIDIHPEEADRGGQNHSIKFDNLLANTTEYYKRLEAREKYLEIAYPFVVEGTTISLKKELNDLHKIYIFLLCASNGCYFSQSELQRLTHEFEILCFLVQKCIVFPNAKTDLFGTSRVTDGGEYKGNLRNRLLQLCNNLNSEASLDFTKDDQFDVPGGDDGIDIVSYLQIDNNPFIPLVFAQCACSYNDWTIKQNDIIFDKRVKRFSHLAPYIPIMYVPFFVRKADGSFEEISDI